MNFTPLSILNCTTRKKSTDKEAEGWLSECALSSHLYLPGQFVKLFVLNSSRKMPTFLKPFEIFWSTFAYTLILTRSSPRDCKMAFITDRGFAKLQILKKGKWPYLLSRLEYCDEILHAHWYWQDVSQGLVNCHLSLVEAFPRSKFRLVHHRSGQFVKLLVPGQFAKNAHNS